MNRERPFPPPQFDECYLEVLEVPSFAPSVFVQFIWAKETFRWLTINTTHWGGGRDLMNWEVRRKILLDKDPVRQYSVRCGEGNVSEIQDILSRISTLSVQPNLKLAGLMLDGTNYTLALGVGRTRTTYQWHEKPDSWEPLEQLANAALQQTQLLNTHDRPGYLY